MVWPVEALMLQCNRPIKTAVYVYVSSFGTNFCTLYQYCTSAAEPECWIGSRPFIRRVKCAVPGEVVPKYDVWRILSVTRTTSSGMHSDLSLLAQARQAGPIGVLFLLNQGPPGVLFL